jgi:hypothetical protein
MKKKKLLGFMALKHIHTYNESRKASSLKYNWKHEKHILLRWSQNEGSYVYFGINGPVSEIEWDTLFFVEKS